MGYRIGLDIGIGSVGWCVLDNNENEEPIRIMDLGSRIFDVAEVAKTGATTASERRIKRSLRRIIRRRSFRIERVKNLISNTFLTKNKADSLNDICKDNVYELRNVALNSKLNNLQLAKILLHLIKRRGFHSTRKSEISNMQNDAEKLGLVNATRKNKELLLSCGYSTIGEMIYKNEKYHKKIYNNSNQIIDIYTVKNKNGDYTNSFERSLLVEEIKIIFNKQREFGNLTATKDLEEKYLKIFESQRPFDVGPGKPSQYSGTFNVGYCTFEPNELRAPKASFSYEKFVALQKINNQKLITPEGEIFFNDEQKKILYDLINNKKEIKYADIRKLFKLDLNVTFSNLSYKVK
jgi:CRISPR-associated endonuclease Csn1